MFVSQCLNINGQGFFCHFFMKKVAMVFFKMSRIIPS